MQITKHPFEIKSISLDLSKVIPEELEAIRTTLSKSFDELTVLAKDVSEEMERRNYSPDVVASTDSEYHLNLSDDAFMNHIDSDGFVDDLSTILDTLKSDESCLDVQLIKNLLERHTVSIPRYSKIYKCPFCGNYTLQIYNRANVEGLDDLGSGMILCTNCGYHSSGTFAAGDTEVKVWHRFHNWLISQGKIPEGTEFPVFHS